MLLDGKQNCRSEVGERFATPVPASTTRCRSSSKARATAVAISCCWGRNSKFFAFESGPFSEKNARMRSTNSVPRESFSAIIVCGNAIVIRKSKIKIRNSRETPRSLRHSQFPAGVSLLHCRFYFHLAHLRYQRQYFDFHRRAYRPASGRAVLRNTGSASLHYSPASFPFARAPLYSGAHVACERSCVDADRRRESSARSSAADWDGAAHSSSQHGAKLFARAARGPGAQSTPLGSARPAGGLH